MRRILLGIGGTPFTPVAIRRAVELAQQRGASVTAVTVLDERRLGRIGATPLGGATAAADLRSHRREVAAQQIEETLEELKQACAQANIALTINQEQGSPFRLMVEYARYHDLMIFGLRSMFESGVLLSDAVDPAVFLRDLIGGGVRPLLAVSDKYRTLRRVLIAYSGSVQSADSFKCFIKQVAWPGLAIRLLVCQHAEDQARQMLDEAAVYCRSYGYEVETCYRPEDPRTAILAEVADWNADLLVIGSSAQSWLAQVFLETTLLHLVRNVDRPIFIGA